MKFCMHLCCQGHELEKGCKLCYKNNSFFKKNLQNHSEDFLIVLQSHPLWTQHQGVPVMQLQKQWGFSRVLLVTPPGFSVLSEACFAAVRYLYLYDTAQNREELSIRESYNCIHLRTEKACEQKEKYSKTCHWKRQQRILTLSVVSLRMSTCYQSLRNRNSPSVLPRYFYAFVTHCEHTYLKPQWMEHARMSHIRLYLDRFSGGL